MKDRQPKYPGRVKLKDVETGEEKTFDMTMADEPTEEGTPPTKANLLSDTTAALFGMGDDAVPNDVFVALALGAGKYGYLITVLCPDGSPASGAKITGAETPSGGDAITGSDGSAVVVSSETTITISVESPYIDLNNAGGVVVESTGRITKKAVTLQKIEEVAVTSSTIKKTSPALNTFDLCGVGGGGGGGNYQSGGQTAYSPGGGGGYVVNVIGEKADPEKSISVSIGAGGALGTISSAGDGGETSVTYGEVKILSAPGGKGAYGQSQSGAAQPGGLGNGNGGGGQNNSQNLSSAGGDGEQVFKFNDESLGIPGGGGGGSGGAVPPHAGGAPNGASGANTYLEGTPAGVAGYGGGGGGSASTNSFSAGSQGGQGVLYFRPHYKGG